MQKTPWYQTALAAGLISTTAGGLFVLIMAWAYGQLAKLPLPLPLSVLIIIAIVLAAILATIIRRKWRQAVWTAPFARLFDHQWLSGGRREALVQQGYEKRDAEIRAERERSPRPSWRVSHEGRQGDNVYYLHNSGWRVDDVHLTADEDFFVFESEAFFNGAFGNNMSSGSTGLQFRGLPTERGKREGVMFSVTWIDQNGDKQPGISAEELPGTVFLPPE